MISNFTFSKALVAFFLVALVGCGGGNNIPPDADGDGIEDSLDAFPNDPTESTDGDDDGVGDNGDNCPAIANSDQVDTDLDGTGDACDDDKDADSVLNDADNCPMVANTNQIDSDVNGSGDACDAMPTIYSFTNTYFSAEENSSVSYTGQTARQVLISDMAYYMSTV